MSCLIDGLPDAVALRCLAFVPYYLHPRLELVSRSWKDAFRSAELFRARREVGSSEEFLCVSSHDPNNICQLYDPLHKLWITLPELPSKIRHLMNFGTVSTSQKMFVIGGCSDDVDPLTGDRDNFSTNEVWSFDLVTRRWSMQAPMLIPRAIFACCVVEYGKIVVAGGFTKTGISTSKAEMYDIENDVWIPLPDLVQTHESPCSGLMIGGKMHVVYKWLSTVQVFDSLELKWNVEDYGWLPGPKAVVQDSLYVMVMTLGHIVKQDGRDTQIVVSASQFFRRLGWAMVGFRGELYMIGGVVLPNLFNGDLVKLSSLDFLNVSDENPVWRSAIPMSRCKGTIFGCTELKI